MRYVFREYGKNTVECYNELTTNPYSLVRAWEAYCCYQLLVPPSGAATPTALDAGRGPESSFERLVRPAGVARVGPWCTHPTYLHPQLSLVIHWPTLFRSLSGVSSVYPPAIFLAGMMLPLVLRKSPAMAHIIHRVLLEQTENVLLEEISNRPGWVKKFESLPESHSTQNPDYPFEYDFFLHSCKILAADSVFIRACRNTFNATVAVWASVSQNEMLCRKYMLSGYIGGSRTPPHYTDCSVLRPGIVVGPPRLGTPDYSLKLREVKLLQQYGAKYRPRGGGLVPELLIARDLATPLEGEGPTEWRKRVMIIGASWFEEEGKEYLAIDWGKWCAYRWATTGKLFRPELECLLVGENKFLRPLEERRNGLCRRIRSVFSPGVHTALALPGTYPVPEKLLQAWKIEKFFVDVIPIDLLELKSYRALCKEKGWTGALRRSAAQGNPDRKPRAHTPMFFSLTLLAMNEEMQTTVMRGFHMGRTIYFQVPGMYGRETFISRKGPAHLHQSRNLPKGILVHEKVYSFSAVFIQQRSHLFPHICPEHLEQLVAFSGNSRQEVAQYVKRHSHKIVAGRPSKYTEAQDNAIITYYRPKIDEDARTALWTVCNGYTPAEISRRAKILQHKLIWEDGVTDTENLPHRRRTKGLLQEIRNAVKVKENKTKEGVNKK